MILADYNALTNRFTSEWESDLPVVFPLAPAAEHSKGCVRFNVVLTNSRRDYGDAITGGKRQDGFVELLIDVPDGEGDSRAIDLMEQFASIFRNWTDDHIVCRTEFIAAFYKLENGLIRFRVSVPFFSIRPYS